MSWKTQTCLLVSLLMAFAISSVAHELQYVQGQIIVKFTPEAGQRIAHKQSGVTSVGLASLDRKMEGYGVYKIGQMFPDKESELGLIYQLDFDDQYDAMEVASDFARDRHVLYAEPRRIHQLCDEPNDTSYVNGLQWYLDTVHAPQAWDITHGDSTVIIGIVDSGVDWDHPDLADNIWFNSGEDVNGDGLFTAIDWNVFDDDGNGFVDDWHGWDFGGEAVPDNNPDEGEPVHGTHVAGIAAAVTDNVVGVAGMSWNCTIMPVKASRTPYDGIRYGYEGIQYAADNGADVITLCWGHAGGLPSQFEQEIIDSAFAKGAILVAAAGNDPPTAPPDSCPLYYPAWYNHVIAAAATDSNDNAFSWTFYGNWVDVSAPGAPIYNTWWNDTYTMLGGTSLSGALVAGVAGLLKSVEPDVSSDEFETRMQMTSDDIDSLNPGYEGWLGGGRLNAYRALRVAVPVVLASFMATGNQGSITLTWITASEMNCHRWEIYRSEGEEGEYAKIAELMGHGTWESEHNYRWVDRKVTAGTTYFYQLKQVDFDGGARWSQVISATVSSAVLEVYSLNQNYPNPFNAFTKIGYRIPEDGHVSLKVFNISGQEVRTLVDSELVIGEYEVLWDGRDADAHDVASGLYFCRLKAGNSGETIKMLLVR
jgi:subtilisin family serine protease